MRNRLAVSLGLLAFFAGSAQAADLHCAPDEAVFDTPSGPLRIAVEIADDPAERAEGLMHREGLAPQSGMLFIYEEPQPVSFWMRNTLIPLDMLFIDAEGVIRLIHPNAKPHDETPIPGNTPGDAAPKRLMVLELAGGEAERLGLAEGMALRHPLLPQSGAAAPCE